MAPLSCSAESIQGPLCCLSLYTGLALVEVGEEVVMVAVNLMRLSDL